MFRCCKFNTNYGFEPKITTFLLLRLENHKNRSKLVKNVCNIDQTLQNYNDDHSLHIPH